VTARIMAPGTGRALEWGPLGEGGGSRVFDVDFTPIRSGNKVAPADGGRMRAEVIELVSVTTVRVRWSNGAVQDVDPCQVRVVRRPARQPRPRR
jgi:hypothetical protein